MGSLLDHLVITAPSLQIGADFVSRALGVPLQQGGEHPAMGTHNVLVRLGDSSYLEVIAINPNAPFPGRPRWFELDRMSGDSRPRLATWVVRMPESNRASDDLVRTVGDFEPMSRGALRWNITIRGDGALICGGLVPSVIRWETPVHPAAAMQEVGCSLVELEAFHSAPDQLREQLVGFGLSDQLTIKRGSADRPPHLVAYIRTPTGLRSLGD